MDNVKFIDGAMPSGPCEYCGAVSDLRPYGVNGAKICFDCGMKPENIRTTEKAFDGAFQLDNEQTN